MFLIGTTVGEMVTGRKITVCPNHRMSHYSCLFVPNFLERIIVPETADSPEELLWDKDVKICQHVLFQVVGIGEAHIMLMPRMPLSCWRSGTWDSQSTLAK